MDTRLVIKEAKRPEGYQSSCRHHWIIDPPKEPVSRGVCLLCGEQREFNNYLQRDDSFADKIGSLHVLDENAVEPSEEDLLRV